MSSDAFTVLLSFQKAEFRAYLHCLCRDLFVELLLVWVCMSGVSGGVWAHLRAAVVAGEDDDFEDRHGGGG